MKKFAVVLVAAMGMSVAACEDDHTEEHEHDMDITQDMDHDATQDMDHDVAHNNADAGADVAEDVAADTGEVPDGITVDGWTVTLTAVDELHSGAETFNLTISDANGPVTPTALTVDAWMPAHGHGTHIPTTVESTGAGTYEAVVTFSMPGAWDVRVNTDGDRLFTFPVSVAP